MKAVDPDFSPVAPTLSKLTGESCSQQRSPAAGETSQTPSHATPTLAECTDYSFEFVAGGGAAASARGESERAAGSRRQDERLEPVITGG